MVRTTPVFVSGAQATPLQQLPLTQTGGAEVAYSEAWLQDLIQKHPEILPVDDIEPGFGRLIPVATEVFCGHGYIDNLLMTAEGGIALVETKLWRNPESRRHVVAQALDYAAALGAMSYAEFESAALLGVTADFEKPASLYAIASASGEAMGESRFIDAVSRNLRRGRMLVLVAGDGIRAETEALANLLQSHAGVRFTFALVAIELFRHQGGVLAISRQIAKTAIIERGVVSVLDDRAVVAAPAPAAAPAAKGRTTMTEDLFMEAIGTVDARLPEAIRTMIERAATLGVEAHWLGMLNFKWPGWPEGTVNLGQIHKSGLIYTDATNWKVGPELAREYNEDLAKAFGGRVRDVGKGAFVVGADGKPLRVLNALPQKLDDWIGAMERFVDRLKIEAAARD
jgi:hypothetical protein